MKKMNLKHILYLILFSIVIKILYLLLSMTINHGQINHSIYSEYINTVKRNDAYWYQKIALNGYPKISNKRDLGYAKGPDFKQSEWAFFPLYPALNHIISKTFNTNFDNSAFILSLIFSILSIIGIYRFGIIFYKDSSKAFFNTLFLFSFPFSFYFSMFYTEALFFTFMIYGFLSIYYNKYFLLSILLVPLVLIRANGIITIIPLFLYFLEKNGVLEKYRINIKKLFSKKCLLKSLWFSTGPLAFIAYGFYQYKMTGYFFAFSIAQAGWYRELMFPVLAFFRRGDFATQFNSIFTIIVILYAAWIWRKLPLSLNIFVALSILLPLCSGSVMSMTRFVSVIFPLFLILSESVYNLKSKYIVLLFVLSLHLLSFYGWLSNVPIGY